MNEFKIQRRSFAIRPSFGDRRRFLRSGTEWPSFFVDCPFVWYRFPVSRKETDQRHSEIIQKSNLGWMHRRFPMARPWRPTRWNHSAPHWVSLVLVLLLLNIHVLRIPFGFYMKLSVPFDCNPIFLNETEYHARVELARNWCSRFSFCCFYFIDWFFCVARHFTQVPSIMLRGSWYH